VELGMDIDHKHTNISKVFNSLCKLTITNVATIKSTNITCDTKFVPTH